MKFTYRSGQRPLAGYTIKRGVGQGGFGEVYFAVSDGGKEVALKLLHRHSDAELRGVAHCLNLKHANLVHLYDLLTDDRADKWVVMEYVFGESLAQWINRFPTGLPADVAKEWFAALARGVSYLHDHGVVHRDLKPANVFVEHGHVKIGDYGLSRRISGSMGGEMTRKVGTPYYMAPEIKNGNYSTSIDVYALGVILFEMLTGHPPFEGQTTEEVLIKHQTDTPDVSRLPPVFAPVLQKALEKDPAKRYANVREFARAVEAVPVMGSADRVAAGAAPVVGSPGVSAATPIPTLAAAPPVAPRSAPGGNPRPDRRFASGPIPRSYRDRLTEWCGSAAWVPVIVALCTLPFAVVPATADWSMLGRIALLASTLGWAALAVARFGTTEPKNNWGRRFRLFLAGAGVGALAFWLDGWVVPPGTSPTETSRDLVIGKWARFGPELLSVGMGYVFYYALATAAAPWWRWTDRKRRRRAAVWSVMVAGLCAGIPLFLWPKTAPVVLALAPVVIAAVAVQLASPWSPPLPTARPLAVRPHERQRRRGCARV